MKAKVIGLHCTRRGQVGEVVERERWTTTLRFADMFGDIIELYGNCAVELVA